MTTMTSERTQAYGRVIKTLEDLGPSKLQPVEQERIRDAADDGVGARAREAAWLGGRCFVGSLGRGLVAHGGKIAPRGATFHWG